MAEYYSDDITWCSNRKCERKCRRNPKLIRILSPMTKLYSFADLEGTSYCEKEKDNG